MRNAVKYTIAAALFGIAVLSLVLIIRDVSLGSITERTAKAMTVMLMSPVAATIVLCWNTVGKKKKD